MKRPILWATLYFISGVYFRLGISEMICLVFALFVLFSTAYFLKKYKNGKFWLLFLFTILGFYLTGIQIERETLDTSYVGDIKGTAVVESIGTTSAGNQKLTLHGDIVDETGEFQKGVRLYAIWTGEERFSAGDRVSFSGELTPYYSVTVPGGYDENIYLRTKGFDGKIYPNEMTYLGIDDAFSSVLARTRAGVHEILDEILPYNESSIMKAMLTGDKEDIPDESYKLYQKTGIVHILCISGLHMSILALYVSFFMEKVLKRSRRASAIVTMLTSIGFLIFTGFTPSAVRAVTMICVVMLARVIFRIHDRLNEIAIAALLILMIQPLYLFHIGFQLSFVTVLGLCLAAEQIENVKQKDRTVLDWLKESLKFSLYASLFSYPLVAYHFYSVSLVGILANLIIIPFSGLLLGFGILSAVLGAVSMPLGVFAAGSVYGILQIFRITCETLLRLPFANILTGRPTELVILLCYVLLFIWLKAGGRKGSWKGAVLLCLALWCAVFENSLFRKETTIAFLDVGQGDAAVISTFDGRTYLIDGGGKYGKSFGENVGKTVILPYLEYIGAEQIEGAFLSHPDTDHMTGLLEILEEIPVEKFFIADYPYEVTKNVDFLKEMLEKYPTPLYTVDNNMISTDSAWKVLYPIQGISFRDADDNHGSMVLKYHCNGTDVLFAGDISTDDETVLLNSGSDVSADILKVSHHGSSHGTGSTFLENTGVQAAVISCGKNNLYGHPHEETLNRLQNIGADIYRTDESGTVIVHLKKDGNFEIETMAERKPLYERVKETMEKW